MTNLTRRMFMKGGTAIAATGAFTGPALVEWVKAWAQAAPWKPEKDALLSLLRPKAFVQAEDEAFVAITDAFSQAAGVKVAILRESADDVQHKGRKQRAPDASMAFRQARG